MPRDFDILDYSAKVRDASLYICPRVDDIRFLEQSLNLDKDDESRKNELLAPTRKAEWLTVRYLLKQIKGTDVKIFYTDYGKPYIENEFIGISHSRTHVALIVSEQYEYAIDMEQTSERVGRLANRFMSDKELQVAGDSLQYKTICWAAKEALFKLAHHDLPDFKANYSVSAFEINNEGGIFTATVINENRTLDYQLQYFFIDDTAVVTVQDND